MSQLDDLNAQLTQINNQISTQTAALTTATNTIENLSNSIAANNNQIASANAAATSLYRTGQLNGIGVSDQNIAYANQVSGFLSSSGYQGLVDANTNAMQQSYTQYDVIGALNDTLQDLYSSQVDVQQQINALTTTTDGN
jgi:peptidoglycan hydrolase CwlO-like protein